MKNEVVENENETYECQLKLFTGEVEANLIQDFMDMNATQLSTQGLAKLYEALEEGDLVIFFRNNHFSNVLKHNGLIYLLLTGEAYEYEPSVGKLQHRQRASTSIGFHELILTIGWEILNDVTGATEMVSPEFTSPGEYQDRLLAMQLTHGYYNPVPPKQGKKKVQSSKNGKGKVKAKTKDRNLAKKTKKSNFTLFQRKKGKMNKG